jgi:hypothetical protein
MELCNLCSSLYIIRVIERRLRWTGSAARIVEVENSRKILIPKIFRVRHLSDELGVD